MDSFEINKIIGAVLGTLLFIMGVGLLAEAIYHPIEDRGPGFTLPEAVVAEAGGEAAPAAPIVPLGVLLASADVAAGQASIKKCASCHNFNDGGANKTGPLLWDVVGRPEGSHEGFAYSEAMAAHNGNGDVWSFENLDHFLASPKTYAPGTKMSFAGVKDPVERANILAYLQTLSATPVAFPPPEAAPADAAPADAAPAPAEGATAPADTAPVATDASPVETPTATSTETSVEGTPAPATTEPAAPAAP